MLTVFLALLTLCLGIFFLSLFFQLSRQEVPLNRWVQKLEKVLISQYGLTEQGAATEDKEAG